MDTLSRAYNTPGARKRSVAAMVNSTVKLLISGQKMVNFNHDNVWITFILFSQYFQSDVSIFLNWKRRIVIDVCEVIPTAWTRKDVISYLNWSELLWFHGSSIYIYFIGNTHILLPVCRHFKSIWRNMTSFWPYDVINTPWSIFNQVPWLFGIIFLHINL